MKNLGMLSWIAWIIVMVGGVDSGFYGIFHFHILEVFLGAHFLGRFIYILVGLSAVYLIYDTVQKKKKRTL